jgi:hypothetical protein
MVTSMSYWSVAQALRRQGCPSRPGKGDHEKWYFPCGRHMTVITRSPVVSPGVVRQAIARMSCLPEGWLS